MVYLIQQGLKSHAVTMFEVGKLTDESLDSFLTELGKVGTPYKYNYVSNVIILPYPLVILCCIVSHSDGVPVQMINFVTL